MAPNSKTSSQGHDIAPGEERRTVDVIVGLENGVPIYRQYYVDDQVGSSQIFEPLDLSDQNSNENNTPTVYRNNKRTDHQKYHSERERLKTFEGVWKSEYNVTKEELAQEGFIYKGPSDRAMCVFCLKSIRKWDKGDSVSGEHSRLYPRCPWVNNKVHHMNIPISNKDNLKKNMRVAEKNKPKFSDMATSEARVKTFQNWIKRNTVTVEALVKAGFFYDNVNDLVTCFHCGTKVPGWDLQNGLSRRHSQNSPDCLMVKQGEQPPGIAMDVTLAEDTEDEYGNGVSEMREETSKIEADMQSPAVQAILMLCGDEYNIEDIRKAVELLRISKGLGNIRSEDILKKLDPVLWG